MPTGRPAPVLWFSTDWSLSAAQIVDYNSLGFLIAFNFRDARQCWQLEDFINVSSTAVTHAANLAFFMVHLSAIRLPSYRQPQPDFRILDLKTHNRARRYRLETITMLPHPPDPDLISRICHRVTLLGGIQPRQKIQPAA